MRGRMTNAFSSKKQMAISIGVLAVVLSITIAFAAFSTNLTVRSNASVTPSSDTFKIVFSSSENSVVAGTVNPSSASTGSGEAATIDNTSGSTPTIGNLKANFTAVGQKVVYEFWAYNAGEFLAYLTDIDFLNASGSTKNKVCSAGSGATKSLVDTACDGITLTVSVDGAEVTDSADFSGHPLEVSDAHKVIVTIEYTSGAVDGDFSVTFGSVQVTYSTIDGTGSTGGTSSGGSTTVECTDSLCISIEGDTLYITDNTGYDDEYDYYVLVDGVQAGSGLGSYVTSYDLTNLELEAGTYAISVQRYSYDGNDSVTSNTITYSGGNSSSSSEELIISLNGSMLNIDYSNLGVTGGMHESDGYGIPTLYLNGEAYAYGNDYFDGNTANLNKILGEGTHTVYATIYIYGTEQTIKSNTITYTYDGTYTTEISS